MPQLDFFMYQNVIIFSIILFFTLSYNLYQNLIKIFKILKTRVLLKKTLIETQILELNAIPGKNTNNMNILVKELDVIKIKE